MLTKPHLTVLPPPDRHAGSAEDFDEDWAAALQSHDQRWFAFPDPARDEQVPLLEWMKARQLLSLLDEAGIRNGRVLEYGCGAAGMSVFLKDHGFDTVAIDLSIDALRVAQDNDERHRANVRPLNTAAADALRLPFPDKAFDVVMSYGLLEHFDAEPLRQLLAEVCRTLAPGGLFVADIIPARVNARALGSVINFCASAARETLHGAWSEIPRLRRAYFDHYHETSFGPEVYSRLLREQALSQVRVQVCRPFPPLAVSGRLENLYARIMRQFLPLWARFDASAAALKEHWGWMYLASGRRRAEGLV